MRKYKIKRKNSYSMFTITLIIIIVTLLMTIGYSIFTTTLNIKGNVYIGIEQPIPTLQETIQPITPGGKNYTTMVAQENFLILQSEELSENTLTINIKKNDSKGKERNLDLSFNLKNISKYDYTNGISNVEIVGRRDFIKTNPTITEPTTILIGQTQKLHIKFINLKNNKLTTCSCTIKIQYEINKKIQEFYIIINFS